MQDLQKVNCIDPWINLAAHLVDNAPICFHRVWLGTRLTESGLRIPKRECGSCLVATLLEQTNYLGHEYSESEVRDSEPTNHNLFHPCPRVRLFPSSHVHSPALRSP
jgi:hypothetical protein